MGEHPVTLTITAGDISMTETFTVSVEPAQNPIRAEDQAYEASEDLPLVGTIEVEYDEGLALTFSLEHAAEYGQVVLDDEEPGLFTYTPDPDFVGADQFAVRIADPAGSSHVVEIEIEVIGINDEPIIDTPAGFVVLPIGGEAAIPVHVTDPDGEVPSVKVDGLPEGLSYDDEAIVGVVGSETTAGSYLVTITAEDDEGVVTTASLTLAVVEPQREEDGLLRLMPVDAALRPGQDSFENHGWMPAVMFGTCPEVADVVSVGPKLDDELILLDESVADDSTSASALVFIAEIENPGDYLVYACGCAPAYGDGEPTSTAPDNDSFWLTLMGVDPDNSEPQVLAVSGFATTDGFNWQTAAGVEADDSPARLSIEAQGAYLIELGMREDGLLLHHVELVHEDEVAEGAPSIGAICAGPAAEIIVAEPLAEETAVPEITSNGQNSGEASIEDEGAEGAEPIDNADALPVESPLETPEPTATPAE